MKTLIITFAVVLCLCNSQAVISGYTQVTDSEVQSSAVLQSLAQFGANNAVQVALASGNLPNSDTNFKLTKINSVYQQTMTGTNYRFNATLTNANNGLVMIAIFVINYQPTTKAQRLVSTSYTILPHNPTTVASSTSAGTGSTPAPTTSATTSAVTATAVSPVLTQQAGGYTLVPADQVQSNDVIQSLAKLGAQNIVRMAVSGKSLPTANSNFSTAVINSVYQQAVNGVNYKFDITLTNSDGVVITGNFVINYQPTTKATLIASSSYQVAPYLPASAQTASNNSTSTAPSVSSTTQSSQATTAGYTPLSADEIKSNPAIKSLADFGAQNITQLAIASGKIPSNSVFTVSNINSVSAQVVNGINYSFNVDLVNADKSTTIVAAYIIYYQSWTNTRKVLATSYVIAPK